MALVDIIRSGVKIASNVTESLKVNVTFQAWIGEDGNGADVFAAPITVKALVDPVRKLRTTGSGQLVMTYAILTILDTLADTTPNPGKRREQPVDPRDVFTLPDGGTAPIVDAGGFTDSATGRGFINEVVLGSVVRGQ